MSRILDLLVDHASNGFIVDICGKKYVYTDDQGEEIVALIRDKLGISPPTPIHVAVPLSFNFKLGETYKRRDGVMVKVTDTYVNATGTGRAKVSDWNYDQKGDGTFWVGSGRGSNEYDIIEKISS